MKIARYWAKGRTQGSLNSGGSFPVVAWGWSQHSQDEAIQQANEAAQRAARWLETHWSQRHCGQYYSTERPPREEILQEIADSSDNITATLTRNSYGSLVLNTAHLMFIDVDVPAEPVTSRVAKTVMGWLGRESESRDAKVLKQIEQKITENSRYAFRLYRTAAGFRCMVTNHAVTVESEESRRLLEAFGADPLYVKLCRVQECYRARLSPKFWRCRLQRPPHRFPWNSAQIESEQRRWEEEYSRGTQAFATCRLVTTSEGRIDPDLRPLVELHDKYTRAKSDLPLA